MQIILPFKWIIRLGLVFFWLGLLILNLTGNGVATHLMINYTFPMLVILTLTFYYVTAPFYAPFLQLKNNGGEVMERSTKILILLASILGALVVAMAIPQSRDAVLNGFDQGLLAPIGGAVAGFNVWLGGFAPVHILGASVLGGLVLAVLINMLVRPRIQRLRTTTAPKTYQGAPAYVPPTTVASTTVAPPKPKKVTTTTVTEEVPEAV